MVVSLILSAISITIAVIHIITTEFRGPKISLLNTPEFKISSENFCRETPGHMPWIFNLDPVTLIFANYGGKAGTILDLKLYFSFSKSFKSFLDGVDYNFENPAKEYPSLTTPITIEGGDNVPIKVSTKIRTFNWKKTALAKVLDPNLKLNDIITKAQEKSKEDFERFCDFLDEAKELGKVSCTVTLTQGRFRTKVVEKKLFQNKVIANHYDSASLRSLLYRWEGLYPTETELMYDIRVCFESLIRDLKKNLTVLGKEVDENNVNSSKLRVDAWKQLNQEWTTYERKIRWFLIMSEEGLKEDLTKLYEAITKYNSSINNLMHLGELRTQKHFNRVNEKRKTIQSDIEKMYERLSSLHEKFSY